MEYEFRKNIVGNLVSWKGKHKNTKIIIRVYNIVQTLTFEMNCLKKEYKSFI